MLTTALEDDAAARRAIARDLDSTLIVEAAAGTGKTTELVNRILRVIATGRARMDEIVAVTFTEKAAGELKLRLREALEKERETNSTSRAVLDEALRTLEDAHVNTIHGFCAELLRERPVEAGVDPLFVVLTETQAARVYTRAFHAWLQEVLQQPPEGVRRALRRSTFGGESAGPIDRLRDAGLRLVAWRHLDRPWHRPAWDREANIRIVAAAVHELADMSADGSPSDNLFVDLGPVRRLSGQLRLEQTFGQENLDAWEARLVDLSRERSLIRTRKGSGRKFGRHVRADVQAARDRLFPMLLEFRRDADADLAALLQAELRGAADRYSSLKVQQGALDFADLLVLTRDLLRGDDDVRAECQRRFTRLFVDEFQDTDPVQAEILLLLSSDDPQVADGERVRPVPGKLFIVGDPKQAIYRFRGADVGTY
jgi:ATP-dependent exoDNAse (exonuclease V) beta subunit